MPISLEMNSKIKATPSTGRLLIVHSTLPYYFTHAEGGSSSSEDLKGHLYGSVMGSDYMKSASGSINSGNVLPSPRVKHRLFVGKGKQHLVRPSVCNILYPMTDIEPKDDITPTETKPSYQWNLLERHNHLGIIASAGPVIDGAPFLYVGWPGHCIDEEGKEAETLSPEIQESLTEAYKQKNCHPVFIPASTAHDAFNGYYRSLLWPLFHYTIKDLSFLDAVNQGSLWTAFETVNKLFCESIKAIYRPGDKSTRKISFFNLYPIH